MNIYSPSTDVFESLKTFNIDYSQLEADGHLIPIFIDVPWNKGVTGYAKAAATEETKEKCRLANLGRKHSDESKRNMGNATRGRTHSPETKEKIKQARALQVLSDETREKYAIAKRGKKRVYREDGSFHMA